jgi:hypothetical protein
MIRRINLFAGPGAGKSTTAAWLYAQMKSDMFSVELIQEYVKSWAYDGREPSSFDQIYLFGKQMHSEDRVLKCGVHHTISDSPLFLSTCYCAKYNPELFEPLIQIERTIERKYPSLNIYIERHSKPYVKEGRYQTYDEAKDMDKFILDRLVLAGIHFNRFQYNCKDEIYQFIRSKLPNSK